MRSRVFEDNEEEDIDIFDLKVFCLFITAYIVSTYTVILKKVVHMKRLQYYNKVMWCIIFASQIEIPREEIEYIMNHVTLL